MPTVEAFVMHTVLEEPEMPLASFFKRWKHSGGRRDPTVETNTNFMDMAFNRSYEEVCIRRPSWFLNDAIAERRDIFEGRFPQFVVWRIRLTRGVGCWQLRLLGEWHRFCDMVPAASWGTASFIRWLAKCWSVWCASSSSRQSVCVGTRLVVSLWRHRFALCSNSVFIYVLYPQL